jgi:hypothetical protein
LNLSPAVFVVAFIFALSIAASIAWAVYAWAAFRDLNGANKRQSAIALGISALLTVPALAVLAFVSDAIAGG